MRHRAGLKVRYEIVVDGPGVDADLGAADRAWDDWPAGGGTVQHVEGAVDAAIVALGTHVAAGRVEAQVLVEAVVEQVTDRGLGAVGTLDVAIAVVEIDRQATEYAVAEVAREHRADRREAAVEARERVALVVADDGQLRVGVGSPGQARIDEETLDLRRHCWPIALPAQAHHPVGKLIGHAAAAVADRTADVEAAAHLAEAAALHKNLVVADELGHLGDEVDDAARTRLPVEHRGRPLNDVDALQPIGIDSRGSVAAARQWQAVKKDRCREPADIELLQAGRAGAAALLRGDTRGVTQRLVDRQRVLVLDLLAADDRDRLSRLQDRCVGLSRDGATTGDVAWNRAESASRTVERAAKRRGASLAGHAQFGQLNFGRRHGLCPARARQNEAAGRGQESCIESTTPRPRCSGLGNIVLNVVHLICSRRSTQF